MNQELDFEAFADMSPDEVAAQIALLSEEELEQLVDMIEGSGLAAIDSNPLSSLADILQILEDDELMLICEMYGLHFEPYDLETASRGELEERAAFLLTHPLIQKITMLDMSPSIRADYLEIMRAGTFSFAPEGEDENNPHARLRGLLDALSSMMLTFPFAQKDAFTYVVPDEIRRSCEEVIAEGFLEYAAENDLVYQYIDAAVNLYGVICLEDLVQIIESQAELSLSADEVRETILGLVASEGVWAYFGEQGLIAHEIFQDGAGLGLAFAQELHSHAACLPRHIPEKEIFVAHANPSYFEENFEAELLTELLEGFFPEAAASAASTVTFVQECARQGVRNEVLIETLFEEYLPGPFANEAQANLAIKQTAKLVQSTRAWACNGHTPAEADKMMGE